MSDPDNEQKSAGNSLGGNAYGPVPMPGINASVCPHCGYCPTCGRPWHNTYPTYPVWPYNPVVYCTSAGGMKA